MAGFPALLGEQLTAHGVSWWPVTACEGAGTSLLHLMAISTAFTSDLLLLCGSDYVSVGSSHFQQAGSQPQNLQ